MALGASLIAVLYSEELQEGSAADRVIVTSIFGGLSTWGIGRWLSSRLRRGAEGLIDEVTITPEPGGAAVRGSLSW